MPEKNTDELVDAFDPEIQKKHEQYLKDGTYQRDSLKRAQAQSMAQAGIIRGGDLVGIQRQQADPSGAKMQPQKGFKPTQTPAPRPPAATRRPGLRPTETISQATRKPAALQAINDLAIRLYTGNQELNDVLNGKYADPTPPPRGVGDWVGNLVTSAVKLPLAIGQWMGPQLPLSLARLGGELAMDASANDALQKNLKARGMEGEAKAFQRDANKRSFATMAGMHLPAAMEIGELAFGDPKKAGQMLKTRALTDPASLVLDVAGVGGLAAGARLGARKAPALAQNMRQRINDVTQPVRTPTQGAQAIETVARAARVQPAPSPGPATARAGIRGFAPRPKTVPAPEVVVPAPKPLPVAESIPGDAVPPVRQAIQQAALPERQVVQEVPPPATQAELIALEKLPSVPAPAKAPPNPSAESPLPAPVAKPGRNLRTPEELTQHTVEPYRYAKDSIVVKTQSVDEFKTPADTAIEKLGGRYVNRAKGYVLPASKEAKLREAIQAERESIRLVQEEDTRFGQGVQSPRARQETMPSGGASEMPQGGGLFGQDSGRKELPASPMRSVEPTPGGKVQTVLGEVQVVKDDPGDLSGVIVSYAQGDRRIPRSVWEQMQVRPDESPTDGRALKARRLGEIYDIAIASSRPGENLLPFHVLTESEINSVKESTGLDLAGHTRMAEPSAFRHMINRHGGERERLQGQEPLTKADFERMAEVLENPDTVEYAGKTGKGLDSLRYTKRVNGHVIIIEELRTKRKSLVPISMIKRKASVGVQMPRATPAGAEGVAHTAGDESSASGFPEDRVSRPEGAGNTQDQTPSPLPPSDSASDIKNISNPAVPRIAPAPLKDGAPARSAKEISLDLGKALGRRLDYGAKGRGKNVLGTFFRQSKRTTIKYRGDLDTTAHEVGHLIDDATGLIADYAGARAKSPFDAELIPNFSQFGSGTTSGGRGKLAYHRGEGVAEFIRAYLFNPDEARRQAPQFTQHFEGKAASVLPQLRAFGDEVRRVAALDPVERGKLSIAWEPGRKTPAEKLKTALAGEGYDFEVTSWDKLMTRWVDDAHPAIQAAKWLAKEQNLTLRPTQDFEILLRTYAGGEATKIRTMLEEGITTPDGKKLTGGGLAWVLEPIVGRRKEVPIEKLDADMKDTALMMIAERTLELAGREGFDPDRISGLGKGLFSDATEAQAILDTLQKRDPAAYKRMQKSAQRYRELSKGMLQYMVDAGRLSQESMDTITAGNQFYVDFSRDLDKQGFGLPGGGVAKGKNVVKRVKGGLDEINNPYRSLLENGFQMIGEADRNHVMRSFRDLVKPDANDKGVNLSAIADELPGVFNQATGGMEAPRDTITVYVDGNPEYWRINIPEVKKYLEGLGKDSIPEVAEATIGIMAKLMKAGVTASPGYMVRNIIRDQLERPFKSRVGGSLVDNFSRIPRGTKEEFLLAGGGQFGSHVATQKGYEQALAQTQREIARDPNIIVTTPGKLLDGYNKLKESGELVTRLQEYKKAKEYAQSTLGYGEADARLYAAYQARDLMDFAVAGEWGRVVNAVVPFTNSKIQGARRTLLAAKENPARFAANLAIMGASGAALVGLIAATGKDRLEEYREFPSYRRDLYWCLPVPGSSKWVFIPKGFEVAVMSSAIERAANYALGDKRAWEGYLSDPGAPIPAAGGTLTQNLVPFDIDELAGPMKSIMGALANYDFFRQKPIVPALENEKPLELRDTSRASRMGQWIQRMTQLDARKADYLMGAMFGNVGRDATRVSDLGRPDKPLSTVGEFALSQTGVVGSAPGPEALSVQAALRDAKKAGMTTNPLKQEFDGLRAAKDPAQYDRARKDLLTQARNPGTARTIQEFSAKRKSLDTASGGDDALRERISDTMRGLTQGKSGQSYELLSTAEVVSLARLKVRLVDALAERSGAAPGSERYKSVRRSVTADIAGLRPERLRDLAARQGIR